MDITLSNCDPKSVTVDLYGPTYSVLRLRRSGDVVCTATISAISAAVIPSDGRGGPARGLKPAKPEIRVRFWTFVWVSAVMRRDLLCG